MGTLLLVLAAMSLAACSTTHYAVNAPLGEERSKPGYSPRNLSAADNSDSLTVLLALSGGGYRAAAMAYAVLEVMNETQIVWDGQHRTLLQELDFVSAVSGGSLAAAFYATDHSRFFTEFRSRVLDYDLQTALLNRALSPRGLWRQTSVTFGRGDLLQELLDEQVFGGIAYAAVPRQRPMVYINATDMRTGDRFEFSQDQFDHFCSDLDPFPIARAVAASMAVPIVFSPITLWNHNRGCSAATAPYPALGTTANARFIHLVDGGLSDNTGVRSALDTVTASGGIVATLRRTGVTGARKVVQIIVNAQVNPDHPDDDSPRTPGLLRQLRSAIDVPIDRYSESSLKLFGEAVRSWRADLLDDRSRGLPNEPAALGVDFHVIELRLSSTGSSAAAAAVKRIPTGLRITPEQIDLIRDFVRSELAANVEWQRLLRELRTEETSEATAQNSQYARPCPAGAGGAGRVRPADRSAAGP